MRPSALTASAIAATVLLGAGCGGDGAATEASALTPAAAVTVAPAPPKAATAPAQAANGRPDGGSPRSSGGSPQTPARYAAALAALGRRMQDAIDEAARTGSSGAIAEVLAATLATTKAWTAAGHPAGAGAGALAAAGQTALTAVESPLLLDEARRQVAAAQAQLGG